MSLQDAAAAPAGPPAPVAIPDLSGADLAPDVLMQFIVSTLDEDKAEDILSIDLAGKSSIADALVIASGRSNRHVGALADRLSRRLKEAGLGRVRVEGLPQADWVLLDAGDVIVHLFRPEVRAYYNIERIWLTDSHRTDRASA